MYKEIIFLFIVDSFSGKQVPDIIEYNLHNPVFEWISNLAIDSERNNSKSLRNCYHSNKDNCYVNRMKNKLVVGT